MRNRAKRIVRSATTNGRKLTAAEETHNAHLHQLLDPYLDQVVVQHPSICNCFRPV
jgi:hypothetical protein